MDAVLILMCQVCLPTGMPIHEDHREAFSNLGLMQQVVTSSDPQWTQADTPRKRSMRKVNSGMSEGLSDVALSEGGSPRAGAHANGHVTSAGLPLAGAACFIRACHCLLCVSSILSSREPLTTGLM